MESFVGMTNQCIGLYFQCSFVGHKTIFAMHLSHLFDSGSIYSFPRMNIVSQIYYFTKDPQNDSLRDQNCSQSLMVHKQ